MWASWETDFDEQADHLEKSRSPTRKSPEESASETAGPQTGVRRKVPKKCFGVRTSVETSTGEETRSTFSALSSAPRLGPALSTKALSFQHFSLVGASTLF